MAKINVIPLNCHGFNIGISNYLQSVACNADIILLQETWLCNETSYKLTVPFEDFIVYHTSSMEDKYGTGVCLGRPFGGPAVLVHKKLSNQTCRVEQIILDLALLT